MGVWHTGDNEYLRTNIHIVDNIPPIREFPCKHCKQVFLSKEDLFDHRFERHPIQRPVLFLRGHELGNTRVLVTRVIVPDDVSVSMCDHAIINDDKIDVQAVPSQLARFRTDVCRLVLVNDNAQAEYTFDFQIAKDKDLIGIEEQFVRTASKPRLDIRAVNEFISASSEYHSALNYCDGICEYLYGVLAKERSPDSSLPYDGYIEKFNRSVKKLSGYERPLARTISSLIEFHFNHFDDALHLARFARVGQAAARFTALLDGKLTLTDMWESIPTTIACLDASVTDWETEKIIRWTISPIEKLSKCLPEIEHSLERTETSYDRVKLHILLAEVNAVAGNNSMVLRHAKELYNLPGLDRWATSKIHMHS